MSFSHLLKYGMSLPPHIALAKAMELVKRRMLGKWRAHAERGRTTFPVNASVKATDINHIVTLPPPNLPHVLEGGLKVFVEKAMAHEFNLLGSDWSKVAIPADATKNPVSEGNQTRSEEIRRLISSGYQAIDWHSDFKSNHQWRASDRSEAISYGHEPMVDIKVPWELARLQHLVQMAFAFGITKTHTSNEAGPYAQEFCDQTLDFISTNPPGYGVNWSCTMDVAIRAANLVMAFDLFHTFEARFTQTFIDEFVASIEAHGTHIINNLEWRPGFRGNHYLADIVGLLIIAAWLPDSARTRSWLAFAMQEFVDEVGLQFNADGSNAEGSTNYHRLSAEMVTYATAVILGLPNKKRAALETPDHSHWPTSPAMKPRSIKWHDLYGPFSQQYFEQIHRMAIFTIDVSKPDGHVAQIGDTDNGRLFKIIPALLKNTSDEDILDHTHLISAIGGLLDDEALLNYAGAHYQLEAEFIRTLKRSHAISVASPASRLPDEAVISRPVVGKTTTAVKQLLITLPTEDLLSGLQAISYPNFGLFLWRSERLFLAIRCGPIGQGGNGGHAHNDQLSIELQIDGVDWLADPGTGVYTADVKKRDLYRSHLAHFGPRLQMAEPSRLDLGLFKLEDNANSACLLFNKSEFLGVHHAYAAPTYRRIKINRTQIEITDSENGAELNEQNQHRLEVDNAADLRAVFGPGVPFSRGYGLPKTT